MLAKQVKRESTAIVARPMTHHETIKIERPHNFVEPWREEQPIAQRTPQPLVDPYAAYLPQSVQQVVKYEITPESRGRALATKTHQVTAFLSVMTLAAMFMLGEWSFLLWLLFASGEWIVTFAFLAILDYREQPQSVARMTADRYIRMMEKEQAARLRAQYGDNE